MSAVTIALCNQKGGVGKTTSAFHLARAGVLQGKTVLVVDADPQGNLTSVAARDEVSEDQAGLADALSSRSEDTMSDVIIPGIWPGLDVVPTSGATLGYVRDELVATNVGRERRMREALNAVAGDYDLILIDCAPSLDQLTINALTAADGVVVITHSKLFSANGLAALLSTINEVRQYYNQALKVAGIVINQHEEQTVSGRTWVEELRAAGQANALPVLSPPIPKRVVISDATEAARGLDEWGSAEATSLSEHYAAHLTSIEGALS